MSIWEKEGGGNAAKDIYVLIVNINVKWYTKADNNGG